MRTILLILLSVFLVCVGSSVAFHGLNPAAIKLAVVVGAILVCAIFVGAVLMMAADTADNPVCECGQVIREGADMDLEDEFVWPPYGSRNDPS